MFQFLSQQCVRRLRPCREGVRRVEATWGPVNTLEEEERDEEEWY